MEKKSRAAERVAAKWFYIETVFVSNTWMHVRRRRARGRSRENVKHQPTVKMMANLWPRGESCPLLAKRKRASYVSRI